VYTEIDTDDKDVATRFLSEQIDHQSAIITVKKTKVGRYFVSVNSGEEPEKSGGNYFLNKL